MIKALMFDLDDTLLWDKKSVKESLRAVCLEAEKATGIDHESFENTVRKKAAELYATYETYDFTKKIGINPFEGLWGVFHDKTHHGFRKMYENMPDYQVRTWVSALNEHGIYNPDLGRKLAARFPYHRKKLPFVYEDTFEVLTELKQNYALFLLTNGAPSLQDEKLEMTPQLIPYFDHILVSGAFGIGKPDPSIFKHSLNLLDVQPAETIMIGDNLLTDIDGANQAGIKNIWINREGKKPVNNISFNKEINSLSELPQCLQNYDF